MRKIFYLALIMGVVGVVTTSTAEACKGRVVTRTGPTGKTLTLCLDGKYSTCLRDSKRLGWSEDQSKRHCDRLLREGRVK